MAATMDIDAKAFLDNFEQRDRSLISNIFLEPVRGGIQSPAAVITQVLRTAEARKSKQWADEHEHERMNLLGQCIRSRGSDALLFAQFCIEWDALPRSEREKIKAGRSSEYQAAAMEQKPVTEKQMSYLAALGYRGDAPANRAEASRIIDQLAKPAGAAPAWEAAAK